MATLNIIRLEYGEIQTLGGLFAFEGLSKIYECKTLELPWKENMNRVSCIPANTYAVKKFDSPRHGSVFLIQNVPSRDMIEIHVANYFYDLLGCIGVGNSFTDINEDGFLDVRNSRNTLNHLLAIMPENFMLNIYGQY